MIYGNVVKVKYLSPTNTRGARWSATVGHAGMQEKKCRPVVVSNDYGRGPAENAHAAAVAAMTAQFTQTDPFKAQSYGDLSPTEYVFIF